MNDSGGTMDDRDLWRDVDPGRCPACRRHFHGPGGCLSPDCTCGAPADPADARTSDGDAVKDNHPSPHAGLTELNEAMYIYRIPGG